MEELPECNALLDGVRTFPPPPAFSEAAHIKSYQEYLALYKESIEQPEKFWASVASNLHWFQTWDKVLDESTPPFYKWFINGKTNICYNCIDRHLPHHANRTAMIFEGEAGDTLSVTFGQLHAEVCKFANTLLSAGIRKGDRVGIYMPMVPESIYAMLACARIGAVHNVIFGGFAVDSISGRIQDCEAKCVITSDGGYRRGKVIHLKNTVDEALNSCPSVKIVIVVRRHTDRVLPCTMKEGRDFWYHEISQNQATECPAEVMDAEDMLFLLYTSGTTGTPKGIVHTTGGYMIGAYLTTKYVFDIRDSDIYWCTADIGWITGHTYVVYGPLLNAGTILIFEGAPNYPDEGRFWELVEKYKVTIFYTAPTAIRTFMRWGDSWPNRRDLSSLRLLGSVGEPINPEAWMWYHTVIGRERCPIVDTWWQTETGSILLTPIPGATTTKPGSATFPFFGVEPAVLTEEGQETDYGFLAIKKPWPSMLRGIYNAPERYRNGYWCKWEGKYYYPADGAIKDNEGYYWIIGRLDDIVNVSGHRVSTAELEGIAIKIHGVAESAFIGIKHEIKGQSIVGFVILKEGTEPTPHIKEAIYNTIGSHVGRFVLPESIIFVPELPKTRSGKIMRRVLRSICEGTSLGNISTLADPVIIDEIIRRYAEAS